MCDRRRFARSATLNCDWWLGVVFTRGALTRFLLDCRRRSTLMRVCAVAIARFDRRFGALGRALAASRQGSLARSAAATAPAPPAATPAAATLAALGAHLAARRCSYWPGGFGARRLRRDAAFATALSGTLATTFLAPRGIAAALTALATVTLAALAPVPATIAAIAATAVTTLASCTIRVASVACVFAPAVPTAGVVPPRAAVWAGARSGRRRCFGSCRCRLRFPRQQLLEA